MQFIYTGGDDKFIFHSKRLHFLGLHSIIRNTDLKVFLNFQHAFKFISVRGFTAPYWAGVDSWPCVYEDLWWFDGYLSVLMKM